MERTNTPNIKGTFFAIVKFNYLYYINKLKKFKIIIMLGDLKKVEDNFYGNQSIE
jgi:hypothetical protein